MLYIELHRNRKTLTELRPYRFVVVYINTKVDFVDTVNIVKSFSCLGEIGKRKNYTGVINGLVLRNIEYNGIWDMFMFNQTCIIVKSPCFHIRDMDYLYL